MFLSSLSICDVVVVVVDDDDDDDDDDYDDLFSLRQLISFRPL